jgi:hypothetical protein
MLRLIHTQVAQGGLLISDIDDGLPRRTAKRGTGDPKKYERDGNDPGGVDTSVKPDVNFLKQKCYLPRRKIGDTSIAGYIDLAESDRVLMSQAKGVINGLRVAGHLTVTSFIPSDLATPVLTTSDLGNPGPGDLTLIGTGFASLAPDITTVYITGTVTFTFTQAQIIAGLGTVSDTAIFIPAAMIPGAVLVTTFAQVKADNKLSAVVVMT